MPGALFARLIAAALLCATIVSAQDSFQEEVERIYREGGYERELPFHPPPPKPRPEPRAGENEPLRDTNRRTTLDPRPAESPPPEIPPPPSGALARFLEALPWIAIAVVAVLLIVRTLPRLRVGKRAAPVTDAGAGPPAPESGGDPTSLSEAERLARQGRYADAIHALLLSAIEKIRAGKPVASSLTSREVLAAAELSAGGRSAFRRLVRSVEITRFGGRPADAAEYEACVAEMGMIAP
jgi:hypothetical protein